jgi:hypothetical protein
LEQSSAIKTFEIFMANSLQHYLHIGGDKDGLSYPAADGAETVQWPVGVTDKDTYISSTMGVGDVFIVVYRHESLTPERVLNRLVEHYKSWCVNRPGGLRCG